MAEITKVLADNLRRLRDEKGLTQEGLADKAKLSLGTIQGYENCRRWPERPYLLALAKALQVPETDLFKVNEPRSPTVDSLLKALGEMQKTVANIPEDWIKRLASNDQHDLGAIAARAFLSRDLREIIELKLLSQIKVFGETILNKVKNG